MRAFIENCRRMAAVAGTVVLGVWIISALSVRPASADENYQFPARASSEGVRTGGAKKMRLGAYDRKERRESLSGGGRSISRAKTSKTRTAKSRSKTRKASTARRSRGIQVASLGDTYVPKPEVGTNLAGGGVKWVANSGCLTASLRSVIHQVASAFGPVTVNSTCRSRRHNARVGGAHHSHHLSGNAVDFRVHGRNNRAVFAFLRSHGSVGGLKLYRGGYFHIDTGSRRSW
ncbi:MAG: DUF882 domain-containing protein [Hyphomicrobium sp.]|nr:DUF882 domain-containing protein [Hyphomicrobium sp.]